MQPLGRTLAHLALIAMLAMPALAFAQDPFLTGATALQATLLTWLTPIAVILIIALGVMAMANQISWAWCVTAVVGVAIAFGAPQIIAMIRGLFAV